MKVHIFYPFIDGPWGGANQFLKAIREYFISINIYEENVKDADVVLFNSSPTALVYMISDIYNLKKQYKDKIFINRIDGPVFYIRDRNIFIDKAFYIFNEKVCDGTIFQSDWSRDKNYHIGMKKNSFETTILNAPNNNIFNNIEKKVFNEDRVKIIATSWSSNWKKGFEVYKWLDENLDFDRFQFLFIGNSPIKFKNIETKKPMSSKELSSALKNSDIFITASQSDPCSNSLIEAMHCGLPSIGLGDGGHTEIISNGGRFFKHKEQIPELLDDIIANYVFYQKNIQLPKIEEVGKLYYNFIKEIYDKKKVDKYDIKLFSLFSLVKIRAYIFIWSINEKVFLFKSKFLS